MAAKSKTKSKSSSKKPKTLRQASFSSRLIGRLRAFVFIAAFASVGVIILSVSHAAVATRVGIVRDGTGKGYWVVAADGGVFSFGDAPYEGSEASSHLNAPIVGMVSSASGKGYWLVGSDGGVYSFGDAPFEGSEGGKKINAPIVGMTKDATGKGYWLVGSDGGVYSFGDAPFEGSEGGKKINAPIVGMASSVSGKGYWLVGSDGGVYSFGDAPFQGSEGGKALVKPIVGITRAGATNGYYLTGGDGGVFSFGATYYGSEAGKHLNLPVEGIASSIDGKGYWLVAGDGGVFTFGDANFQGTPSLYTPPPPTVALSPVSCANPTLTGSVTDATNTTSYYILNDTGAKIATGTTGAINVNIASYKGYATRVFTLSASNGTGTARATVTLPACFVPPVGVSTSSPVVAGSRAVSVTTTGSSTTKTGPVSTTPCTDVVCAEAPAGTAEQQVLTNQANQTALENYLSYEHSLQLANDQAQFNENSVIPLPTGGANARCKFINACTDGPLPIPSGTTSVPAHWGKQTTGN